MMNLGQMKDLQEAIGTKHNYTWLIASKHEH